MADLTDASLREQVERHVGRALTDDEWQRFRSLHLGAEEGSGAHGTGGVVSGTVRSLAAFVGILALALLAGLAVSAVVALLVLGLVWAYSPGSLDRGGGSETSGWDALGFLFVAVIFGFTVMANWSLARVLLGIGIGVGMVAIAIGALIRVVGG